MKKVIKKAVAKKPMSRKPMMKSGGAKRSLRKYQGDEGSSEVATPPAESTAKSAPAKSFSELYKANLAAGLRPGQAKRIAMVESGVKEPKRRIDPNAFINAIGNTAVAAGNVANAFRRPPGGSTSGPAVNPGSTSVMNQNPEMQFEKRGGAKKKKGGATKALPKAGPGKIIKAVTTGIKKAGKTIKNELTPDKGGYNPFKKKTPIKTAAKIGTLGAGYLLGAKALLDRDAKKQQLLQKKKTAKPSKPKQLGPQSFAKGGTSKMAMKKTTVRSKKK